MNPNDGPFYLDLLSWSFGWLSLIIDMVVLVFILLFYRRAAEFVREVSRIRKHFTEDHRD